MAIAPPYLLFLGDAPDSLAAKTAQGIAHWRAEWCLGQLCLPGCRADLKLPDIEIPTAARMGARTMIIGVANSGGVLPSHWVGTIVEALEHGLDVASGLHMRLVDIPEVAETAARLGRQLHDVRHPTREFPTGKGERRPGRRLLTVGTDCSVGKMYTSLAIEKEMRGRGMKADFRATGQTGIFIAGDGVSVDAVVADFISGATEWLTPANDPDHWDVVEGQGSLFHPSYAGVSLGLLHGAAPDALVLCHEPTRSHIRGLRRYPIPDLQDCMEANIAAARLVNPQVRVIGISINTSNMKKEAAADLLAETEDRFRLPCVDPFLTGVRRIVDHLP